MQTASRVHEPLQSAGRLFTEHIPVVGLEATIADVERLLINKHQDFDTINYIYVVDRDGVLCGVISIKTIFRVPKTTRVKDVMVTDVVSARSTVHQERIAHLALRHNLKAIPLVDKEDVLLGVVPADTILSILQHEAKEDLLISAGVHHKDHDSLDLLSAPVLTHVKKRLPWLLVGAVGGSLAAFIISQFESVLATELLLAAFIPTLVYMTDAVATQSEMLFVHAASLRDRLSLRAYLVREVQVSALLAVVLAALLSALAFFWFKSLVVGLAIAIGLFLSVVLASMLAVLLPWLLLKLRRDPAVASGPFVTILTDLLTIVIYFGVAQALLILFA